jgi:hypothetical protein
MKNGIRLRVVGSGRPLTVVPALFTDFLNLEKTHLSQTNG